MPELTPTTPGVWLVAGFFILVSLAVYGVQAQRLVRHGGKVPVDVLGLPELLMSLVFAGFFTMTTISALRRGPRPVTIEMVLPNSMLFIIFVAGIVGFMRFQGLPIRSTFGLTRLSPLAIFAWVSVLLLAAFAPLWGANVLTYYLSHGRVDPQPLVDLFIKVASQRDYPAVSKILVSAVLIQPACEEFLFRGFFYGVWKRYLGPLAAGFLSCLLFAAFHTNLSALAGLFLLAVFLNIAYERTGSLLVPIGIHACFNLVNLLYLLVQAQTPLEP